MMNECIFTYNQQDGNQNQPEKKMPNFNCMLKRKESFLDVLAHDVMLEDFGEDGAFFREEFPVSKDVTAFCEWLNIPDNGNAYDVLISIIYEYQRISFNAGFKVAKELLK